ncbi:MAG: HAD family phosphatase [Geminicoccaceae bacterium]
MPQAQDWTVVFDLGGVLIDWNPRYLFRPLFKGDEAAMERFLAEVCTPQWNHSLDEGRDFATAVADLSAQHPEHADLIAIYRERWIEMVQGPIEPTVAVLKELAATEVPLFALTNWSAETFHLVRHDPTYAFLKLFREIFVSGELGLAKPDAAIFRHVLNDLDRPAERCLFIDDSGPNIACADALGFRTHRFVDAAGLRRDLMSLGLLPATG